MIDIFRCLEIDCRIPIYKVVQSPGPHNERNRHDPGIGRTIFVINHAILVQVDQAIGKHIGKNSQILFAAQKSADRIRNRSDPQR